MPTTASSSAFDWKEFDQTLANLLLAELSETMSAAIAADERQIRHDQRHNENSATVPALLIEMQANRAEEWARGALDVYRDVWQRQSKQVSPAFLRAAFEKSVPISLAARVNSVSGMFNLLAIRTGRPGAYAPHIAEFRRKMQRAEARLRREVEIEAKSLEHSNNAAATASSLLDLLRLPSGFRSQDPVEASPFLKSDSRYRIWQQATRRAEQEIHMFNAAVLGVLRDVPHPTTAAEAEKLLVAHQWHLVGGKFDIWAKRNISVVRGNDDIEAFGKWLENYANGWLITIKDFFAPSGCATGWLINELRVRLISRIEFWRSEATRYVIEQNQAASKQVSNVNRGRKTPRGNKPQPSVGARRTIVKANQAASAQQLCRRFDMEGIRVQWDTFSSWADAYKSPEHAKRIRTMIAKDKTH